MTTARRFGPLVSLALTTLIACAGQSTSPATAIGTSPAPSAPPSASSAPEPLPAGYSKQQAVVTLHDVGAAPRHSLSPDFDQMAPSAQSRSVTAWSATSVGTDASDRVTLHAAVRMPSPPSKSSRKFKLTFELPDAEQHLTSTLLGASFEDRSEAPFLGFARALLPSALVDVAPDTQLGIGATWEIVRQYSDAGTEFSSRRRYKLLQWTDPAELGVRQSARIATLEFVWVDGAGDGSKQVTSGRVWHSAAWLYPVGLFQQEIQEAEISLETTLRLDNPAWPKLSAFIAAD